MLIVESWPTGQPLAAFANFQSWLYSYADLTVWMAFFIILLFVAVIYKYSPVTLSMGTRHEIEKKLSEHRKSELKFMGLLESAPDAMVITGEDGKILLINAQTEKLFGFHRNELIGQEVEMLIPEKFHQKHRSHRYGYVENPKTRAMGAGLVLYGKRKDGNEFPVEISLSPMKITGEEGIIILAAIRDISKQKAAEAEIKKLNENLERVVQELEAINRELEAFSYSVSHDLRAPLRSIEGFSNKILKDYSNLLDDQGKDYFMRVKRASQHMENLIEDLLRLSRLSQVELHPESTNLSAIAGSIAAELKVSYPERKADMVIQPEMIALVDKSLMQIALQNLLGNAWKYSRSQLHAIIEFGSFQPNGQVTYYIRDNGAGFDMKYADKLFRAFQRLHSASEFEGNGIGLATVQRIIHRHQGKIWAESEVNKGTTFFFTL